MSVLSFEMELARKVAHQPLSLFSRSVTTYIRSGSKIEVEQLSDVRGFIERYAFSRRQLVDLKEDRIQQLFDQALANVIQTDCANLLKALEDQQEVRNASERVAVERAQQEASSWQQKGTLGRVEALVVQMYRKITQKAPQKPPLYEDEKEEMVFLETAELKEEREIALLQEWAKDPLSFVPFTSVAKEIDYIRNILLPKAKEMQLESHEEEKSRKAAPTLSFRRIA